MTTYRRHFLHTARCDAALAAALRFNRRFLDKAEFVVSSGRSWTRKDDKNIRLHKEEIVEEDLVGN